MFETKILVVEDDPALQEALTDILSLHDYDVVAVSNAEDALVALNDEIGMVFSDIRMDGLLDGYQLMQRIRALKPHLPIVLMTAYGTIEQAVSAMKLGAVDYLVKPFEATVLVEKARSYFQRDASEDNAFIAVDPKTQQIKQLADKVAKTDASVLIQGASGSGKEVLARYVHQQSTRADQPFVAINCAAIPDNMIEAVLFGYEKGAFTGALKSMPGKFEQAQGGTLFLDEIGELKADLQAKLLRVLQEREVERIGATKTLKLDVRIISATNIDMSSAINEGRFREDLFYRLNVFPLNLPGLAQRPADIVPIAMRLISRYQAMGQPCAGLDDGAAAALQLYGWPGNIRELDNVIQRAMVMRTGERIGEADLLFDQPRVRLAEAGSTEGRSIEISDSQTNPGGVDLKTQEMNLILATLKKHHGHRQKTADELNLSARTLRYKLAKYKELGFDIE